MSTFDLWVVETLYAVRSIEMTYVFIIITELGSTVVIGGLSLACALFLLGKQKISYFAGLCISIVGSAGAVYGLKELIGKARPDVLYQAYLETGFSFPSGHAAFSLTLYGFIGYLIWKHFPHHRIATILIVSLLVGLIGFSRLYLGVHYPSDIVGGFMLGVLFLAVGIAVVERLNRSVWS